MKQYQANKSGYIYSTARFKIKRYIIEAKTQRERQMRDKKHPDGLWAPGSIYSLDIKSWVLWKQTLRWSWGGEHWVGSSTYRKEGRKHDCVEGQTELQGSSRKALADPRELCSVCRPLELSCIGWDGLGFILPQWLVTGRGLPREEHVLGKGSSV